MKLRIIALAVVITAALAAFAIRTTFFESDRASEPSAAASQVSRASAERAAVLEQQVRDRPNDVGVRSELASLYVERARETGDPAFYTAAEEQVAGALELAPDYPTVLVVAGVLALARHDFEGALAYGERARAAERSLVASYGVITDALVELGRYDEAIVSAQEMADRRPDFAALSRISYLRELHGDLDGAIAAMREAADAGTGAPEDEVWARVLLGNLLLTAGDVDVAAREYEHAASILPGDPMTLAGLARLAVARGDLPEAQRHLQGAVELRPLPEYLIALGDVLAAQGRTVEAEREYATVRAIQQLFASNGVDTDLELALFDADHGADPGAAYEQAIAAYQHRQSVYAADTVAWAAYRAGRLDEAQRYIAEARRLGTRDPRLSYHAGVIALAAGDAPRAERELRLAIAHPGALSLPEAAAANETLDAITAKASR